MSHHYRAISLRQRRIVRYEIPIFAQEMKPSLSGVAFLGSSRDLSEQGILTSFALALP